MRSFMFVLTMSSGADTVLLLELLRLLLLLLLLILLLLLPVMAVAVAVAVAAVVAAVVVAVVTDDVSNGGAVDSSLTNPECRNPDVSSHFPLSRHCITHSFVTTAFDLTIFIHSIFSSADGSLWDSSAGLIHFAILTSSDIDSGRTKIVMSCGRIDVLEKLLITAAPEQSLGIPFSHISYCFGVINPVELRKIAIRSDDEAIVIGSSNTDRSFSSVQVTIKGTEAHRYPG